LTQNPRAIGFVFGAPRRIIIKIIIFIAQIIIFFYINTLNYNKNKNNYNKNNYI